jgi:hypothetical protein
MGIWWVSVRYLPLSYNGDTNPCGGRTWTEYTEQQQLVDCAESSMFASPKWVILISHILDVPVPSSRAARGTHDPSSRFKPFFAPWLFPAPRTPLPTKQTQYSLLWSYQSSRSDQARSTEYGGLRYVCTRSSGRYSRSKVTACPSFLASFWYLLSTLSFFLRSNSCTVIWIHLDSCHHVL